MENNNEVKNEGEKPEVDIHKVDEELNRTHDIVKALSGSLLTQVGYTMSRFVFLAQFGPVIPELDADDLRSVKVKIERVLEALEEYKAPYHARREYYGEPDLAAELYAKLAREAAERAAAEGKGDAGTEGGTDSGTKTESESE